MEASRNAGRASSSLSERAVETPKWKMLAASAASALPRREDVGEVRGGACAARGDDGNAAPPRSPLR